MVVWWTIPGSSVAWEWRPAESLLAEGDLIRDREGCHLIVRKTQQHRWPGPRQPVGQPFAEMTAAFAMEANIRPTGMAITWIDRDTAVRWDRPTDRWVRHPVGARYGHRCLFRGTDLPGVPVPLVLEDAATTAIRLLGP